MYNKSRHGKGDKMKKLVLIGLILSICVMTASCGKQDNISTPFPDSGVENIEQNPAGDSEMGDNTQNSTVHTGDGTENTQGVTPAPNEGKDENTPTQSGDQEDPSPDDSSDIAAQLELIASSSSEWIPGEDEINFGVYSYAVTDLDQNGRLEIIVSSCQGTGFFTYSNIWQVSESKDSLDKLEFSSESEYSQPDIIIDQATVYYDAVSKTYNYIFEDYVRNGYAENFTTILSLNLNASSVVTSALSSCHNLYTMTEEQTASGEDGAFVTTYTDADGNEITQSQYENAAAEAFSGCEEMTALFGWISDSDALFPNMNAEELLQQLSASYEGFSLS